jgi:hypothetical protein
VLVRPRTDEPVAVKHQEKEGALADGIPAFIAGKLEVLEVQLGIALVVTEQRVKLGGLADRSNDLVEHNPFCLHPPVVDLVSRREDGLGPEGQDEADDLSMDVVLSPGIAVNNNIIRRLSRLGGCG